MTRNIRLLIVIFCLCFWTTAGLAQPTVLITYYSKTGNTHQMAEAVARGAARVQGVQVILKTVNEVSTQDLLDAGAIIVGSPVYNANVAPAVMEFMTSWPFEGAPLKGKLGAAFVTAGGISAGEEVTMLNILKSMLIFGMIVMGGDDWSAAFGASAIRGEPPFHATDSLDPAFLQKAEKLGERVASVLMLMQE